MEAADSLQKDLRTAYIVVKVLSKTKAIPEPLRLTLEKTSNEIFSWYSYYKAKEEKNV